jgi:hypothetical protein
VFKDAGLDGQSLCKVLREMSIEATKANFAYSKTLPLPTCLNMRDNRPYPATT